MSMSSRKPVMVSSSFSGPAAAGELALGDTGELAIGDTEALAAPVNGKHMY